MLAPQSSMGLAFGTRAAALLLGVSLAFAAGMGPARADKVGVAAAVEPDAFSSLSGILHQVPQHHDMHVTPPPPVYTPPPITNLPGFPLTHRP
jgi:hypothetical protein